MAAVSLHLDSAYTFARYLARRSDLAEDVFQEALLRAYRGFESQRGENVRAWLLMIVRNCFLTLKARDGKLADISDSDISESLVAGFDKEKQERQTPESILIQHEESHALRALIEQLPQSFREVLVLRDVEDMSYREIAEITQVPIGTVMSRLARARKMIAVAWKGSETSPSREKLR